MLFWGGGCSVLSLWGDIAGCHCSVLSLWGEGDHCWVPLEGAIVVWVWGKGGEGGWGS